MPVSSMGTSLSSSYLDFLSSSLLMCLEQWQMPQVLGYLHPPGQCGYSQTPDFGVLHSWPLMPLGELTSRWKHSLHLSSSLSLPLSLKSDFQRNKSVFRIKHLEQWLRHTLGGNSCWFKRLILATHGNRITDSVLGSDQILSHLLQAFGEMNQQRERVSLTSPLFLYLAVIQIKIGPCPGKHPQLGSQFIPFLSSRWEQGTEQSKPEHQESSDLEFPGRCSVLPPWHQLYVLLSRKMKTSMHKKIQLVYA